MLAQYSLFYHYHYFKKLETYKYYKYRAWWDSVQCPILKVPSPFDTLHNAMTEGTSQEIQNRGTSSLKIGHVYVSAKNILKKSQF